MKGRLRNAWIRCARRTGIKERLKLAEEKRVSAERGGRPCLSLRNQPSMCRLEPMDEVLY